jgi:putative transposase
VANKIVSGKIDGIALENLNISGMMRRCWVKFDD